MAEFRPSSFKSQGGGVGGGRNQLDLVVRRAMQTTGNLSPPHYRGNVMAVKEKTKKNNIVKMWWNDPETKRRKRVAKYKLYAVEGKVKSSLKKGFRWVKKRYSRIVHGV